MRGIKESIAIGAFLAAAALAKDSCNNGCRQERAVQPAIQQFPEQNHPSPSNYPRIPVELLEQQPKQQPVDKERERIHCAATKCLS